MIEFIIESGIDPDDFPYRRVCIFDDDLLTPNCDCFMLDHLGWQELLQAITKIRERIEADDANRKT